MLEAKNAEKDQQISAQVEADARGIVPKNEAASAAQKEPSAAQEEVKYDSDGDLEPVMMNPQDMIDEIEDLNAKKDQIISKIEPRLKAKRKILEVKHNMVMEEQELILPVHLDLQEIEEYFVKGAFFAGERLKVIIIKAFRECSKVRGDAVNLIRDEIYSAAQRMPNICIVESKRLNNAFFLDSPEYVIYRVRGLQIRVWFWF